MAITLERRKTSKQRLEIDWDYPASVEIAPEQAGRTRAAVRMRALPRDEAIERLRGEDRRPLLVVRECNLCKGTDDALLSRALDNEKTLLLSRWFHCVKLQHHVLQSDHTFNAFFEGERPPHLFLASADGTTVVPMPGTQSQSELWEQMTTMLRQSYERDPKRAIKEIIKILSRYDHLDSLEDHLLEQVDMELEKNGPKSSKLKKLRAKLEKVAAQKSDAEEREAKVSDLRLRSAGGD